MEKRFTGTVVRATGSWYEVRHDGETVRCRMRGRLRLQGRRSTNPVVVGDEVACEADDGGDYVIADIAPRRNGTYTVTLAFNDDESQPILKMELMVPKDVMAKDLAERFQKNPEQLYTGVLNTLFSEPDEGK